MLVQCVTEHESHRVGHGQLNTVFEKVHLTFISNVDWSTWTHCVKPSVKTLREKLRALIRARRSIDSSNAAVSAISKEITELDQILGDLILEKDREEEVKKLKREEASPQDTGITQKGFERREEAACRTQKETAEEKNKGKRNVSEGVKVTVTAVLKTMNTIKWRASSSKKRNRRQVDEMNSEHKNFS